MRIILKRDVRWKTRTTLARRISLVLAVVLISACATAPFPKERWEVHADTAAVALEQGRLGHAEQSLLSAIIEIQQARPPRLGSWVTLVNRLGQVYQAQGKHAMAEEAFKRVMTPLAVAVGWEHPMQAYPHMNLAGLYAATGRPEEAERAHKRVLGIWEKAVGENHPYTAASLGDLAEFHRAQRRYPEAEPLFQRALAIWDKTASAHDPHRLATLEHYALLLRATNRPREAEATETQAGARRAATLSHKRRGASIEAADGQCALSVTTSPDGSVFTVRGQGFAKDEELLSVSRSDGEVITMQLRTTSDGSLPVTVLAPWILGRLSGLASTSVVAKSCMVTLYYEWRLPK